jgi:N-acetyl sugar amidotransferase
MPDTKPGITFDADGVCSACQWARVKATIDWAAREQDLAALCDEVRGTNGNGYDCVVPVSGGKDSMYQALTMSRDFSLKVLAVTVPQHLQTAEGIMNLNALVENVDVDLLKLLIKPTTLQHIRRLALFKLGNPSYADHRVMFAAVTRAAVFYNTPLVVWGEDIAVEFGGNVKDAGGSAEQLINNDLFRESSFEDLIGGELPEEQLFMYSFPPLEDLRRRNIRSIYLGHYRKWDGYHHWEIARDLGFQARREGPLSGNILHYDNIDEKLCEIHIWFKFLKLGFWRPHDQCCYWIWTGRMSREEAVEHVHRLQYDFPYEYLPEFLEYHHITNAEFWDCAERWRNPDLWHRVGGEWRLRVELS